MTAPFANVGHAPVVEGILGVDPLAASPWEPEIDPVPLLEPELLPLKVAPELLDADPELPPVAPSLPASFDALWEKNPCSELLQAAAAWQTSRTCPSRVLKRALRMAQTVPRTRPRAP